MARHETGFQTPYTGTDPDDPDPQSDTWQGFPASAVPDKPGQERKYTLDRIERTIGSIL